MPKKRSASTSDSDSGPEDRMPDKKVKQDKPKADKSKAGNSEGGEQRFPLDKKRNVTVREFKGTVYVDIREFYEDKNGDIKPGKKGVSLSVSSWNKLKDLISDIDDAVSQF